jgi:hypothetical protein
VHEPRLEVAGAGLDYSARIEAIRREFARGRAWLRPWCGVNHRPLEWAFRSLTREFEVVIMVERAIGEMVGSDRVPPERLHANLCRR